MKNRNKGFTLVELVIIIANMTTNLLAPVVINRHSREARQVVLEKTQYTTKHRLFPEKKEAE